MKEKLKIDLGELKAAIIEVLHENPDLLRSAVIEYFEERKAQYELLEKEQKAKIEEIVKRDFERYADVFRALAEGPK